MASISPITKYPRPEVGQVWEDTDKRSSGRTFTITAVSRDDYGFVEVHDGIKRGRIRCRRLKPGSAGYRLVRNADGTRYQEARP